MALWQHPYTHRDPKGNLLLRGELVGEFDFFAPAVNSNASPGRPDHSEQREFVTIRSAGWVRPKLLAGPSKSGSIDGYPRWLSRADVTTGCCFAGRRHEGLRPRTCCLRTW